MSKCIQCEHMIATARDYGKRIYCPYTKLKNCFDDYYTLAEFLENPSAHGAHCPLQCVYFKRKQKRSEHKHGKEEG